MRGGGGAPTHATGTRHDRQTRRNDVPSGRSVRVDCSAARAGTEAQGGAVGGAPQLEKSSQHTAFELGQPPASVVKQRSTYNGRESASRTRGAGALRLPCGSSLLRGDAKPRRHAPPFLSCECSNTGTPRRSHSPCKSVAATSRHQPTKARGPTTAAVGREATAGERITVDSWCEADRLRGALAAQTGLRRAVRRAAYAHASILDAVQRHESSFLSAVLRRNGTKSHRHGRTAAHTRPTVSRAPHFSLLQLGINMGRQHKYLSVAMVESASGCDNVLSL